MPVSPVNDVEPSRVTLVLGATVFCYLVTYVYSSKVLLRVAGGVITFVAVAYLYEIGNFVKVYVENKSQLN